MANLWNAIRNVVRGKSNELAEKIADPVRDGKLAIEDSKKQIASFTEKIAKLTAHNKQQIRKRDELEQEVKKYHNLAVRAAQGGNENDARQALELKLQAEQRFNAVNTEVEKITRY